MITEFPRDRRFKIDIDFLIDTNTKNNVSKRSHWVRSCDVSDIRIITEMAPDHFDEHPFVKTTEQKLSDDIYLTFEYDDAIYSAIRGPILQQAMSANSLSDFSFMSQGQYIQFPYENKVHVEMPISLVTILRKHASRVYVQKRLEKGLEFTHCPPHLRIDRSESIVASDFMSNFCEDLLIVDNHLFAKTSIPFYNLSIRDNASKHRMFSIDMLPFSPDFNFSDSYRKMDVLNDLDDIFIRLYAPNELNNITSDIKKYFSDKKFNVDELRNIYNEKIQNSEARSKFKTFKNYFNFYDEDDAPWSLPGSGIQIVDPDLYSKFDLRTSYFLKQAADIFLNFMEKRLDLCDAQFAETYKKAKSIEKKTRLFKSNDSQFLLKAYHTCLSMFEELKRTEGLFSATASFDRRAMDPYYANLFELRLQTVKDHLASQDLSSIADFDP